ncbi:hypothetical protein BDN67DRAFT_974224 [Paxillus ammoniavirescens]|nr:hypothetical protein BDN67DRAFT_974224 [Paxillus ammoniavirescens]
MTPSPVTVVILVLLPSRSGPCIPLEASNLTLKKTPTSGGQWTMINRALDLSIPDSIIYIGCTSYRVGYYSQPSSHGASCRDTG